MGYRGYTEVVFGTIKTEYKGYIEPIGVTASRLFLREQRAKRKCLPFHLATVTVSEMPIELRSEEQLHSRLDKAAKSIRKEDAQMSNCKVIALTNQKGGVGYEK